MPNSSDGSRANSVRGMFAHMAPRYDMANRWMTLGQDVKWRREVIDRASIPKGGSLLDIGAGTGDLALEAIRRESQLIVVGADFTPEMMNIGRKRQDGKAVLWLNTDALALPFISCSFDAVVSGYLVRNVVNIQQTLAEQYRILKMGGQMVCLDTTPPPGDLAHLPVRLYLRIVIPFLGGLVARDINTYRYLPESTRHFIKAPQLADRLSSVGFKDVGFRCFMGGSMAIHWGTK